MNLADVVPAREGEPAMSVNYTIRRWGDVTVLDLSGRISQGELLAFGDGTAMVLHDLVRGLVQKGSRKLLLNLRHVTYVDSSGLGELVACRTTLQNHEGELRVCTATPAVEELLRVTHLDTVLNLDKDEATSLQWFAAQRRAAA
jgi:anti-sigma B factor antagonist